MLIKRILGADHVFGAPPDWDHSKMQGCAGLPVRMVHTPDGNFMVSAWEPTPDELRRMIEGEPVYMWVRGLTGHPVVSLTVAGDPDVGI